MEPNLVPLYHFTHVSHVVISLAIFWDLWVERAAFNLHLFFDL